jgi:glycosyltransferase involved in cell wall biosynthesis
MAEEQKSGPMYSVIIPTLNEAEYISLLLADFQKQVFKNFENLIVDGHSDDSTLQEVESFRHKMNLRVLMSDKKNVSYQRNFGAAHARGKFLIFVDADCRIHSVFMKKLNAEINKSSKVPSSESSQRRCKIIFIIQIKRPLYSIHEWFFNIQVFNFSYSTSVRSNINPTPMTTVII